MDLEPFLDSIILPPSSSFERWRPKLLRDIEDADLNIFDPPCLFFLDIDDLDDLLPVGEVGVVGVVGDMMPEESLQNPTELPRFRLLGLSGPDRLERFGLKKEFAEDDILGT
jgi:hypothetical protein